MGAKAKDQRWVILDASSLSRRTGVEHIAKHTYENNYSHARKQSNAQETRGFHGLVLLLTILTVDYLKRHIVESFVFHSRPSSEGPPMFFFGRRRRMCKYRGESLFTTVDAYVSFFRGWIFAFGSVDTM
jgi:hypothetical protein